MTCSVKPRLPKKNADGGGFELITIEKNFTIKTESKEEMQDWMTKIQDGILTALNTVQSAKEQVYININYNVVLIEYICIDIVFLRGRF